MPRKNKTNSVASANTADSVTSLKYPAKRKNIPPAGLEAQGVLQEAPKLRYEYNPHLPPVLRSATDATEADKLPELLAIARQRALSAAEAKLLADALRRHEPWLEWSGKREKPWFEVEPVALHMHERISTQAILRVLAREDVERDLFADPQHDYAQAVQFYQHDMDWANRMILGDSLQVMASLARREDLPGKVQMIYFDPPYGIKFASNFQPQLGQRDVKDREQDLTREPEMVKAYRDTWTLGIHSYLAYLRDRLAMAHELLADTGSIFVQISDENLHRVRCVMDEVFKPQNFVGQIVFRTTSSLGGDFIPASANYLLWFARDKEKAKFRPLFRTRGFEDDVGGRFSRALLSNGTKHVLTTEERAEISRLEEGARIYRHDNLTSQSGGEHSSFPIKFEANSFTPGKGFWKTNPDGIERLKKSERIAAPTTNSLTYVRFLEDFPLTGFSEVWSDTQTGAFTDSKIYVVQTNTKVIERCLLMTSDPGDLVRDPTCGSGTTAYVAETWGRRWITCDSSRVALALAKHRLMTAKFDYQQLRPLSAEDVARNPNGTWISNPGRSRGNETQTSSAGKMSETPHVVSYGEKMTFKCKTVPHITLKSIARNTSLDPIFAKHEPILATQLERLNREVAKASAALKEKLVGKLIHKHREEGANAVTDADTRRWLLPDTAAVLIRSWVAKKPFKGVTPKQAEAYRTAIPKGGLEGLGGAL